MKYLLPDCCAVVAMLSVVQVSKYGAKTCARSVRGCPFALDGPDSTPAALYVYVSCDLAEYAWERVLEAGRGFDIQPLGWEGLRALGLAAF